MNVYTNAIRHGAIALLLLLPISCGKEGHCSDGYDPAYGLCIKEASAKAKADTGVPSASEDADVEQEGGDGETEKASKTPTGFADPCSSKEQCAGKEADWCSINPLDGKGMCTTRGCNSTDECPAGYYCCLASQANGGHMCTVKQLYDLGKGAGAC
jgi:hypothetical protein